MVEEREEQVISAEQKFFGFADLRNFRELFFFFTWRDIKIRYKQTILGFLWVVLQPLIMMTMFTYLAKKLQIVTPGIEYPVFAFSGLMIWSLFSSGLTNASNSMVNNASIIKKIYFPRIIIPVSSVLVAGFDFLVAFILFIPVVIFFSQPVAPSALYYWPLALLVGVIATLGPGTLLAAMNVKYRDFRYVLPFLVQVLFFMAPVIYPAALVQDPIARLIHVMSPVYAPIELFRIPLTGHQPDWVGVEISIASGLILFIVGLVYFKRTENYFADFA